MTFEQQLAAREVTQQLRASDRRTQALVARLRRDGHLIIGASDSEQHERYAQSDAAREEEFWTLCRTLKDIWRASGVATAQDYARATKR